jgi:hypothetical protein
MLLLAARAFSNVSSVITMLVFLMGTRDNPCTVVREGVCVAFGSGELAWWRIILAGSVTVLGATIVIIDVLRTLRAQPHRFTPGSPKVRDYLVRWITSGGRAAIVSRNLSWVDASVLPILAVKAKKGDLTLYVPEATEAVRALAKLGARVEEYGGEATRSRFTIVNVGRGDARVAIGAVADDGIHVVREYSAGDPVLVMAQDLLDRLTKQ